MERDERDPALWDHQTALAWLAATASKAPDADADADAGDGGGGGGEVASGGAGGEGEGAFTGPAGPHARASLRGSFL